MNIKIAIREHNLPTAKKGIDNWNIPKDVKKDMLDFLNDLSIGKVNKGKRLTDSAVMKYIRVLKCPLETINKPLTKFTIKDIEKFEKALTSGELKSWKKQPYAHSMKVDMRVALRIFLKWKLGSETAMKLTDWLDTRDIVNTPDYLKESEIEKLYKKCKSTHERYLIAVLFDTGARAEEFHNIRYEDIEFPKDKDNFVKITFKEEYSKTSGRTISLYWKHSIEAIKEYLDERIKEGIKSNDPVYPKSYDSVRFFLNRLGEKVLNKQVYCHLFRHSSATYYASKLNRQELCYRYGWKFSSNMPDVYISRAGMVSKELDVKMTNTELGELKLNITRHEQESKILKEKYDNVMLQLQDIREAVRLVKISTPAFSSKKTIT